MYWKNQFFVLRPPWDILINSECDFGIKRWKLNSVNKLENTVFGRQTFSKRYSTPSKCKPMSTKAGNSWLSCSQWRSEVLQTRHIRPFPGKRVRKVLGVIKRNFWNRPKKRQGNRLYSYSSPEAWISLCRLGSIPARGHCSIWEDSEEKGTVLLQQLLSYSQRYWNVPRSTILAISCWDTYPFAL